MLDVALWSKYPESFVEAKIEPALIERGIRVTKHLSERTKQVDLSGVSAVLYLHELTSHSEHYRINNLAQSQGKKVIPLSRKQSQWDRNLLPLQGENMATQHAISDNQVADLCNTYMALYKSGTPRKEMIAPLQKFWANGTLTNENQLEMQLRGLVTSRRAPSQFRNWFQNKRKSERYNRPSPPPASTERVQAAQQAQKLNGQSKTNGHSVTPIADLVIPLTHPGIHKTSAPAIIPEDKSHDRQALDQLLHEEAEKFANMKKELEAKMAETNAKMIESNKLLESLRIENNRLKSQPIANDSKLRGLLAAAEKAVETSLMNPAEAFAKVIAASKS